MLARSFFLGLLSGTSAYSLCGPPRGVLSRAPIALMEESAAAGEAATAAGEAAEEPLVAYFCNEEGCWIGTPPEDMLPPPVTLPDGRTFDQGVGVESHDSVSGRVVATTKRKPAQQGIFAPLVGGAKAVMGEKELNSLRGEVIKEHSKVISAFVDTSESQFGQIVLKQMFEAADKDGNGTLDREEIRDALHALGFRFIQDKQIDKIFERGDVDDNQVIDFEEFVTEAPKTLRSSLVKLAKQNGHDLGFLA